MQEENTQEFRCKNCDKLFFKGVLPHGSEIEIKCKRCKKVMEIKNHNHHMEEKED